LESSTLISQSYIELPQSNCKPVCFLDL